jgi:hypothetical protein
MAAVSQALSPSSADSSMAGSKSDQKDAAIITPAANPIIISNTLGFMDLKKKTSPAPSAVTK